MKITQFTSFIIAGLPFVMPLTFVTSSTPISLHPDNSRYFLFRGKPTVLITSGEHYGAVLNLDFDYVRYLNELQSHNLNLTRTFSGTYLENWGEGWNTLNPAPGQYIAPWARSSTKGYTDGGNKFDLDKWDEKYFRRLKDFVAQASKRDIVVEMVLFCTFYNDELWNLSPLNARNNVNGIGNKGRAHVYDESDSTMMDAQEKVVKKIISELREFDNVYFELCNEPYFANGPELGSPWNDRIIKVIREVSDSHLIALNVANGSVKVEEMYPAVSVFNFHYCRPPDAVAMNYHHNKVIAFDESGFKGPNADNYRRYAWDFILAGGAVFSNLDWSFTVDSEDGKSTAAEDRLGPKEPSLRRQLGHLKQFIEEFNFINMKPQNQVIKGGIPGEATARALVEDGKAYAIYVNGGNKADLELDIPVGTYTVEWINTKTGKIEKTEKLGYNGGMLVLNSPDYSRDIALSIKQK